MENLSLDCSKEDVCDRICRGAAEVYNLAADMGGMGFIERNRVECPRSILINTHMIDAASRAARGDTFFLVRVCLHHAAARGGGHTAKRVGRLSGDGRTGLRMGKAAVGDVLPGVLG